jgi:NADPH:quinone reductase-like Zn-dependent oxidoreductase
MTDPNTAGSALWLRSPWAVPRVGDAPLRVAGAAEVVVRVRALAMNPADNLGTLARRVVLPWLRYPAVLGCDVAGEVVAIGSSVTRFQVGDRVLGPAAGTERAHNRPDEGAFQTHVVLQERVTSALPDTMSFESAAVLPLALCTAAAGLFERDQLALDLPAEQAPQRTEVVLVWGGSTSVGTNAIQLAKNAGYRVLATCSPRNFALVGRLGAEAAFDYRNAHTVDAIARHVDGARLAGIIAIGAGSLRQAIRITRQTEGTKCIASAIPSPPTRLRAIIERSRGITISAIWGGTPIDSPIGPAIYRDFLPAALADGRYVTAPEALVSGTGLDAIPAALARLRAGVSAQKVVVTIG